MMRYFELSGDMHVPRRWYLGDVTNDAGDEPDLRASVKYGGGPLRCEVFRTGKALDFTPTAFAVPVATTKLATAIAGVAGRDVQRIRLDVPGHRGFEVLNALRAERCLDESRCQFMKWTEQDHRADLSGQYRMVVKLRVLSDLLPADAHFFRIEGWSVALIVSERVKEAMEEVGCLGAKFDEVT